MIPKHYRMRWLGVLLVAGLGLMTTGCGSSEPPPPREEDKAMQKAIQEPLDKARAAREASEAASRRADEALKEADQ